MDRTLGRGGPAVSPLGYGAFKIGRNAGVKYASPYDLPDEVTAARLLNGVLDMGIRLIDTAPAYGTSEQRIGRAIAHRRSEFVLSTKAGERFEGGRSSWDFSGPAIERSAEESLRRLRTDAVDLLLLHSDGRDIEIQREETGAVAALCHLKRRGLARRIGLSGKTPEGARSALAWADVLMVEYHPRDRSHEGVIAEAAARGVGVLVKKPLGSGRLDPGEAIRFVLGNPGVCAGVVSSLSLAHLRENLAGAGANL
ncbi:MAG: aldo/keto reductase [Planctomycetes bacterium]|nr:aldo/keto reductase [Planctomycetota bacterium]